MIAAKCPASPVALFCMIDDDSVFVTSNDRFLLRLAEIADTPFHRAMLRCEAMWRGHVAKAQTLVARDDLQDRSQAMNTPDTVLETLAPAQEPLYAVCVDYGDNRGPKLGNEYALYSRGEVERAGAQILESHRRGVSAKTRIAFREATVEERKAYEQRR